EVIVPLIIGTIVLVWFIRRQLSLDEPILEFRVLRYPMFTLNTALGMCVFMVMIGGMVMLPLYLQNMQEFSELDSGLALLPGVIVMGLMSPVTGRIIARFGAKLLAIIGFLLVPGPTFMFSVLTLETTFAY